MKNTILFRILLCVVIPFLLVYVFLVTFILRTIFDDKMSQAERDIRNLARFNGVNFQSFIEKTRLSVTIAANGLERIDPAMPNARIRAEQIILSSFGNSEVYNSWLVFEPNAFDGRDDEHRGEYPGETSGRFMRSYVRKDTGYIEALDMEEGLLDNMETSFWYLVPKRTGKPFIDISTDYPLDWDYNTGDGVFYSITLSAPVMREGQVIGCVGQDILFEDIILDSEFIPGAISALISPTGILRYYHDSAYLGKPLEEIGFTGIEKFEEFVTRREEFILRDEYSPLLQTSAIAFFSPMVLDEFGELLYVYAAVPESLLMKAMNPLFGPIVFSLVFILLIFIVSLFYIIWTISKPIHNLIVACEAISQGNFNTVIAQSRSRGEIGVITQSLYRMVEQFKIYIAMQERSRDMLEIYTRLHNALYQRDRVEDVFDEIIPLISDYFKLYKASLVVVSDDNAVLAAAYDSTLGLKKEGTEYFTFHRRIVALLSGRKYISMNLNAIRGQNINFLGERTRCFCVLPFHASGMVAAYVIMEGDSEMGHLIHDDTALLFISQTVSYMLDQREAARNREPVMEPQTELTESLGTDEPAEPQVGAGEDSGGESPVLQAARSIEGLDVDDGLLHIGGSAEQYGDLLRISARSFEEMMEKMRSLYHTDLSAFGIEVHGIKGALYAIGAAGLGDEAKALEFAAKSGDADQCRQGYPVFEEKLAAFTSRLAAVSRRREAPARGPGDISALTASLKESLEASRIFDSDKAGGIIGSLLEYSWDDSRADITGELEKISNALESMDYDEAEQIMNSLLGSLV